MSRCETISVRLTFMNTFEVLAVLLCIAALFGYLNERYIKLPTPIGVTLVALLLSLGLLLFASPVVVTWADNFLLNLDFNALVLEGMLSFLLFAGALTVNLEDLSKQKWVVLTLATVGVLTSTLVVGGFVYLMARFLGLELPLIYALLFGSLISPTDPIAMLSILKRVGVPKDIGTLTTGESLFNDGVGVVIFSVILSLVAEGHGAAGVGGIALLFAQEALGGIVFGLVIGLGAYYLLNNIDNHSVEILITLALVTGGYALALALHTSGPLAMVVAGLLIGNRGRLFAMSDKTRKHLNTFWEMTNEILNAVLFVLIGLEMLILDFSARQFMPALLVVPIVLLGRLISVGTPISLFRLRHNFLPCTVRMMVWGGLRGGISVALALSLPPGEPRDLLLVLTYSVVVFAILVQGLTLERVASRVPKEGGPATS